MKKKISFGILILLLFLLTGCGKQKLSEVTQEEMDAVEPEGRIVCIQVWYNADYGYMEKEAGCTAFYDTGKVVMCNFGYSESERWHSLHSKEYDFDYINNADLETDKNIKNVMYIDSCELAEYILRLNKIDEKSTETYIEETDPVDDGEWKTEYYGIRYEEKPVFVFLYQEIEADGTRIFNDDVEAQKAFELIRKAKTEIALED